MQQIWGDFAILFSSVLICSYVLWDKLFPND